MGFLSRLLGRDTAPLAPLTTPEPFTNIVYTRDEVDVWSAADLYRSQPHLRTVISFLARNAAHCALQSFERVSDTDRRRTTTSPSAQLFTRPNSRMTGYELIYAMVSDLCLFDRSYLWITADANSPSGYVVIPIPPSWVVGVRYVDLWTPKSYLVSPTALNVPGTIEIPAEQILYTHGWDPENPRDGSSPVSVLQDILDEQTKAMGFRRKTWQRGPQISGVIQRPVDAPEWDIKAQQRFLDGWRAAYTGADGSNIGGVPFLGDGMTFNPIGFSPQQSQYIESIQLSFDTVCAVYHLNPTIVGDSTGASYSSVKEFRKILYGDTLGPLFAQLEARFNAFLLPLIGEPSSIYVEFNIGEKLQGDFAEQVQTLQASVGGPFITRDEARAMLNMPQLSGQDTDLLIVPMNVTKGGQASPQDSAPALEDRSGPGDSQAEQQPKAITARPLAVELESFLTRQHAAVASIVGSGKSVSQAWDDSRWHRELSDALLSAVPSDKALVQWTQRINADTKAAYEAAQDVHDLKVARDHRISVVADLARDIEAEARGPAQTEESVYGHEGIPRER